MTRRMLRGLALALLGLIGLGPLLILLSQSLLVDGHLSLARYGTLLATPRTWGLVGQSLSLASFTTLLSLLVGVPLGVLLGKTDLPCRLPVTGLFTIPLLVPPYLMAVSWLHIFGRDGWLARGISASAARDLSVWFMGLPGCVLVLWTTFLPIVTLLTMSSLRSVDPRQEEAGRLVAGWGRVLTGISLSTSAPGIGFAAILVFLLTLGEFGVPMFLKYAVFSVEGFTQFSAFHDVAAATTAAGFLASMVLLILSLEAVVLQQTTRPLRPVSEHSPPLRIPLGHRTVWWVGVVSALCAVLVIAPILTLVAQSASFTSYRQAFVRAGDSLLRSLAYAAIGTSCLVVVGFLIGEASAHSPNRLWRGVDALTVVLFAIPSTVIGIGLIDLWNRPATAWIYASPLIILCGYLVQYTALTSRITRAALAQIPPALQEAAQLAGAGWMRRTRDITLPLIRPGLLAGWLVGYLFCLRDTGITMMVYPPGGETLPVRIFTLMANSPPDLIAALCVLMIIATVVPLGLLSVIHPTRWVGESH